MNKKNGFTLVELLIVMAIVAVLAIIVAGVLNPATLINKGKDAQRKKDLNRIKIAFEEYFNDKGCYPNNVDIWNISTNCNSSSIFSPYLSPWPCDPNGQPYIIKFINCTTFKVITNLQNKKDNDIPTNWYTREDVTMVDIYTKDQVNYGVSSSNILWYDTTPKDYSMCNTSQCAAFDGPNCEDRSNCEGSDCFYWDGGDCTERCRLLEGMTCP